MKSRWRPEQNEKYWYLSGEIARPLDEIMILHDNWDETLFYIHENVFRTKKEAQAKLKKIREVLGG